VRASPIATSERVPAAQADTRTGKYLVFDLSGEECCIQVLKVREIIGIQDITAVPQTPNYVRGVINLRGKVIPVVDLRLKFGIAEAEYTQRTCIIVVQVERERRALMMGIVVDSVTEVLNISAADIEDTPNFGQGVATPYLLGLAKIKGKVKLLLDIDEVMNSHELSGFDVLKRQDVPTLREGEFHEETGTDR
jgi:purine-binding chemotaxis protein CheW